VSYSPKDTVIISIVKLLNEHIHGNAFEKI